MTTQNGVLVLQGHDRVGGLAAVTKYLFNGLGKAPGTANIRCGWVRAVGPCGAVVIYFQCDDQMFKWLEQPTHLQKIEQELSDGVYGKRRPGKKGLKDKISPITLSVHPANPLKFDDPNYPRKAHRIARFRVPDQRRALFLITQAIAARDIEIAQHDGILRRGGLEERSLVYEQAFRCYGESDQKIEVCFRQALNDIYASVEDTRGVKVQQSIQFGNPNLGQWLEPGSEPEENAEPKDYAYFVAHCKDRPGLLATVAEYLSSYPPTDLGIMASRRTIVRSCCRGLGGRAVFVLACPSNQHECKVLDDDVREFLLKEGVLDKDDSDNEQAQVFFSRESPWQFQRAWLRLPFSFHGPDSAGMIARFCDLFISKKYRGSVNVIALDAWAGDENRKSNKMKARNAWGLLYDPEKVMLGQLRTDIEVLGKSLGGEIHFDDPGR